MTKHSLTSALFAGCAVGLLGALLHFAFVQNVLLLGEKYESGALVHFENAPSAAPHSHDHTATTAEAGQDDHAEAGHSHDHGATDETSTLKRNSLTVLFTILVYTAYALLLVAGFSVATAFGKTITPRDGLLWGIAGFASFQLAPAMGLPPELPGSVAAALEDRQIWWWLTVACTATGLALIGYGRSLLLAAIGVVILALPHLIGAPRLDSFGGIVPPELSAEFAARVLGVGLAVWAVLGWATAWFLARSEA
jgi:cobalt transporter subunit CbtA